MIGLPELQQRFVTGLLDDQPDALDAWVVSDHFSAAERLGIYRNNIYTGLSGALQNCFAVVHQLVGEDCFSQAARGYIRAHPSRCGYLQRFGAGFPAWLADLQATRGLAYLADVARLEWARQEVYHAAEAVPFDQAALADVAPADYGRLCFRIAPAVRWVQSRWPVQQIWELHQRPDQQDWTVDLDAGGQQVLVVRQGLRLHQQALELPALQLLELLARGVPLGAAVDQLLTADMVFDLQACLQDFIAMGVCTGRPTLAQGEGT